MDEKTRDMRKDSPRCSTYSDCCDFGQMGPQLFDPLYPDGMKVLFDNPHFMAHIYDYNNDKALA